MPAIDSYFPLATIRPKQEKSIHFIERAIESGCTDIVVEAPTGVGKSGIGIAAGLYKSPAYYFVTQKMLQDQLEHDFDTAIRPEFRNAGKLLKGSSEYACPVSGNCLAGRLTKKCALKKDCTYRRAKNAFCSASIGITNYAYYFTERTCVDQLSTRTLAVFDECHGLEGELLRFNEATVSDVTLRKHRIIDLFVPRLRSIEEHRAWLEETYLPDLILRRDILLTEESQEKTMTASSLTLHIDSLTRAINLIDDTWVFWQEEDAKRGRTSYACPVDAAPYFDSLIASAAPIRVYLSAFPGSKELFCRSVGLDINKTAWQRLNSPFPLENRRITFLPSGSLGRASYDNSIDRVVNMIKVIAEKNPTTKGVIHCHSYHLGEDIAQRLRGTSTGRRIIFPDRADQRDEAFRTHCASKGAPILMSPSFVEGYDFKDDRARWQIIAKVPYPSLGNKVVAAKKDADPEWYALQTVMKIVQASGRIVRSEDDTGETYILDSDFGFLLSKNEHLFPLWWLKALCRP